MSRVAETNALAWAIALQPAIWFPIDVTNDFVLGGRLADLLFGVALVVLLWKDAARLRVQGIQLSPWWGVLAAPLYLYKRRRRTGGPRLALIWFVALGCTAVLEGSIVAAAEII